MEYDPVEKVHRLSFTSNNTNVHFTVRSYWSDTQYNEYYSNVSVPKESWVGLKKDPTDAGTSFSITGLISGKPYVIELTGVPEDTNRFQLRYVDGVPESTVLYIYNINGSKATQLGVANADARGNYTFSDIELDVNQRIIFSRNEGATTVTGTMTGNGRYCPPSVKNIPGRSIKFSQTNSGYWLTTRKGTYFFNVNWSGKEVNVSCDGDLGFDGPESLFLYSDKPNWANRIGQAAPNADGIFKFSVYLSAGTSVDLSTKSDATDWSSMNSEHYTPGDNHDMPIISDTFGKNTSGAWKASLEGRYHITVDWNNKKFTAEYEEVPAPTVNMPLTMADFKDNKKHYFLVGERMGEWHLQPEWELVADANGNLAELQQRFIYNQKFAVAVVSSYADYIDHKYMYYSWDGGAVKQMHASANDVTLAAKSQFSPAKGVNNNNKNFPYNNWLEALYDNGGLNDTGYYQGRGRYMSNIVLDLDASGNPTKLTFVPGTTEEAATNRVFTLVGSGIYNNQFCNGSGPAKTPTYNEGGTSDNGWQEGWIQYDPATNKPYVDGRGEYLYLTAFSPDYMTKNPVRFQQTLPDGSEFEYGSGQIRFLEWSKAPQP